MSYIEEKYREKIQETFRGLSNLENGLIKLLSLKSLKKSEEIAKLCAIFNSQINLILKKFYPEIIQIKYKLDIKSTLMFYYDLIDKVATLIRHIETFQKIDPEYYEKIIDFIKDKDNLIAGQYRSISTEELTSFYDPTSRERLEELVARKFAAKSREFFTFGSLEEEVRKYAKAAGADRVVIKTASDPEDKALLDSAQTIITFTTPTNDEKKSNFIREELRNYLERKGYKVKVRRGVIITDIKLLPDA